VPDLFTRILFTIFAGYLRFIKVVISFILRIFLLALFSVLIVFPLWYCAIHCKTVYNIFVLVFLSVIILIIGGVKSLRYIKAESKKEGSTGHGLPVFFRFFVLGAELYVIRFLLLSDWIVFKVAGLLLASEFLFFLCFIKNNKEMLLSWMKTLLIVFTSFEFLYLSSVFFTRGNPLFSIFLGGTYLIAIGYLLYKPGTLHMSRSENKDVYKNDEFVK
jgi:hypothetical protein